MPDMVSAWHRAAQTIRCKPPPTLWRPQTFVIALAQRISQFLSHPSSCLVLQFFPQLVLPDR